VVGIVHRKPGSTGAIQGKVLRIRYESPEKEFQVVVIAESGGRRTAAVARHLGLIEGEMVVLEGTFRVHDGTGDLQLHVERAERSLPATEDGIVSFLSSGVLPGVGPKIAGDMVARFGPDVLRIMDEEPERLREVPGIGSVRLERIVDEWGQNAATRGVMIFLQSHAISPAYAHRVVRVYGQRAVALIKEDPYRLARDIRGIGFGMADRVAEKLGIHGEDPRRVMAGIEYALDRGGLDGHMYVPSDALVERASALLEVPESNVEIALEELVQRRRVVVETLDNGARATYLRSVFDVEVGIAAEVRRLMSGMTRVPALDTLGLRRVEQDFQMDLAPSQRSALQSLVGAPVGVLTGGPGTGKTTIVRAVTRFAAGHRRSVALAAPTGRAARRLSESTGDAAATLHRLLAYDPRTGAFQRDASSPLECDLLIVDEASMLDARLMHALLVALPTGSSLLLVGDVDQLPSVGAGDVLRGLIDSGHVPVGTLRQIFRQSGGSKIIDCAHAMLSGTCIEPDRGPKGEYFMIPAAEPTLLVDTVVRLVTERIPNAFGLDPLRDVQVLVPMHSGIAGTRSLNAALQEALGATKQEGVRYGAREFHLGDKVMQVRNNYQLDTYNGDIGVVTGITSEPKLTLEVTMGDRSVTYAADDLDDLELAYAITVHKSQGSEFPAVVLALMTHHFKLLQRNLVYTAVTRARQLLVVVGMERALRLAVDDVSGSARWSRLPERIRGDA